MDLWMSQIGRRATDAVDGILMGKRYLIHDRDPLFTAEFQKPPISTFRVDRSMKNKARKRFNPLAVQTSTVKKSAATISSQCCARNSFHVVFRLGSGAGSMSCRRRILAIVLRASLCPSEESAS